MDGAPPKKKNEGLDPKWTIIPMWRGLGPLGSLQVVLKLGSCLIVYSEKKDVVSPWQVVLPIRCVLKHSENKENHKLEEGLVCLQLYT